MGETYEPSTAKEKRPASPAEIAALLAIVNEVFPPEHASRVREGVLRVSADTPDALHGTEHDWETDPNGGVVVPVAFLLSPELDLRTNDAEPIPSGAQITLQRRRMGREDERWEQLIVSMRRGTAIVFARFEVPGQTEQEPRWQLNDDRLPSATIVRWTRLLACVEWENEAALSVKFRRAVGRGSGHEPLLKDMEASVAWGALRLLAQADEARVLAAIEAAAKEE